MTRGMQAIFLYLGLAWTLGSLGQVAAGCSSSSEMEAMMNEQIDDMRGANGDLEKKLNEEIAAATDKAQEKITAAKEKLTAEQEKLDQAGADLQAKVTEAEGAQKAAIDAGDKKEINKTTAALKKLEAAFKKATAGPTKRRDAAAERVAKLEADLQEDTAGLQKSIAKSKEELTKEIEAVRKSFQSMPTKAGWKPWIGFVLGAVLIGLGVAFGFMLSKAGSRIGKPRFDLDDGLGAHERTAPMEMPEEETDPGIGGSD